MRGSSTGALDARVGRIDPARPANLQAEAALPTLQRAPALRLLPYGRVDEANQPRGGCTRHQDTLVKTSRHQDPKTADAGEETSAVMTNDYFRELLVEAIDSIPRKFAREIDNVAILIEDEPSDELLEELGMDPEVDTLLGLYEGTPLPERSTHGYVNQLPDRITLFKGTIEDECDGDEDEIIVAIGETLIHELGHYFGMSEEQIMEIEDRYWRGEPDPDDLKGNEGA